MCKFPTRLYNGVPTRDHKLPPQRATPLVPTGEGADLIPCIYIRGVVRAAQPRPIPPSQPVPARRPPGRIPLRRRRDRQTKPSSSQPSRTSTGEAHHSQTKQQADDQGWTMAKKRTKPPEPTTSTRRRRSPTQQLTRTPPSIPT